MSDLRRHPRIPTELTVEVINAAGNRAEALIRNLSPGGLMIDGDLAFKELVCQGQDKDPLRHPIEVTVSCLFPGESLRFSCPCRLIYVRRLSQYQFNLGLRFVRLQAIHAERLERYVMRDFLPDETRSATPPQVVGAD